MVSTSHEASFAAMASGAASGDWRRRAGIRRRRVLDRACPCHYFGVHCWLQFVTALAVGAAITGFLHHSGIKISVSEKHEEEVDLAVLWPTAEGQGWQPATAPRTSDWPLPQQPSNGYLMVRCNGGLNQQRSAICNAVLAARVMNATLVLPQLDANLYWHDKSDFAGIYDVAHFISYLKSDVEVVRMLPQRLTKIKRQLNPPRDAPIDWYTSTALKAMRKHGVIYLTPFSHRMAEEFNRSALASEWQRLRCRVNFEALRFRPEVERAAALIVERLRQEGPFVAVHLRFEMDMVAFAGCVDIFTPEEQALLLQYRKENFADKKLESSERRRIGKCPLTPEEVGLILQAMGYPNTTRIYVAAGEVFGGDRFMVPLRAMYPLLTNRSTVLSADELAMVTGEGRGLLGPAVDYLVCLKADIFMPTYDGPSNFANNVMGHRLFNSFGITIRPNRKALARMFDGQKQGTLGPLEFRRLVNQLMRNETLGGPCPRQPHESFYTNPWPECFCRMGDTGTSGDSGDVC